MSGGSVLIHVYPSRSDYETSEGPWVSLGMPPTDYAPGSIVRGSELFAASVSHESDEGVVVTCSHDLRLARRDHDGAEHWVIERKEDRPPAQKLGGLGG